MNAQKIKIRRMLFGNGFSSLAEENRPILDPCNEIFRNSADDFRPDGLSRLADEGRGE